MHQVVAHVIGKQRSEVESAGHHHDVARVGKILPVHCPGVVFNGRVGNHLYDDACIRIIVSVDLGLVDKRQLRRICKLMGDVITYRRKANRSENQLLQR